MPNNYFCYPCKRTLNQQPDKKCPTCGGLLIGKSDMGKGLISLVFGSFWGLLAMVAFDMDKIAFYLCFTVFIVLFTNGVWKVYHSMQIKL